MIVDPTLFALRAAERRLRLGWIPGRFTLLAAEREVGVGYPGATQFTLYAALLHSYMLTFEVSASAAERFLVHHVGRWSDPRETRFIPHPVLLGRNPEDAPHRLMVYGARATKLQCIDLVKDLIRERSAGT